MIFYLTIASLFWLLAILPQRFKTIADCAAFLMFFGVAGLRQNTGFDWIVYEQYFLAVAGKHCYTGPQFEPIFWLLSAPLTLISSDVSILFLTISLTNTAILFWFCRRFCGSFALPAALVFCWVYLALEMSVLRQSLAVSALTMALAFLFTRTLPALAMKLLNADPCMNCLHMS